MKSPPQAPASAQSLLSPHLSPWPDQPCGQLTAPPSPQPQAAKVGSLMATLHNSAPFLLSLFLPDTQLLLFLWITFLCYAISVVFPLLPPPPYLPTMAGFLRRLAFGESCTHICSLGCREGPVWGSGPTEPGHTGQWRPGGRARGAWQ